jgi:hypothetical protein
MSIQSNFPAIAPTLNLSFALTKALDPRITFTRASTGTFYGTQTAKAEQNLLLYSQEFNQTNWPSSTNITYAENTGETTAPDGTSTADKITAISGTSILNRAIQSVTNSNQVVFSVFAKKGTHNFIQLLSNAAGSGFVNFNLDAGTFSATTATGSITSVGNGWYRCVAVMPASTPTNFQISIAPSASATRAELWSPVGTETILLWGAQLEQRSAVTDYTATTTQPITNYVPQLLTAASGVARFDHNPITDESLGLLIEEQRTNLFTYSEDFANAAWQPTRASITANTIVAPDGTLTGDKLVEDTTATNTHSIRQNFTLAVGTYTYSVFAKAGERTILQCARNNSNIDLISHVFNLATGVATGTGASMTSVGNGWYRCVGVITVNTAASTGVLFTLNDGSTITYTGNGFSGLFLWGAQLEAGAFPTSYVATVASQVTRAADAASMTGANFSSFYNQAEGTLYGEFAMPPNLAGFPPTIGAISDGTISNQFAAYAFTSGLFTSIRTGAVSQGDPGVLATPVAGANAKFIFAYQVNNCVSGWNGSVGSVDTTVTLPTNNQLRIGVNGAGNGQINSTIRKLSYYPLRIQNNQLQALTS